MTDADRALALHKRLGVDQMLRQNDPVQTILAVLAAVRAEEREACAKIADAVLDRWLHYPDDSEIALCEEIAAAIRARKP